MPGKGPPPVKGDGPREHRLAVAEQSNLPIEQTVKRLRALWERPQTAALRGLRHRVEQAPCALAIGGKLRVPRRAPFLQNRGNLRHRDCPIVERADYEVMRLNVGQFMPAIGVDPLGLLMPAVAELPDCAGQPSLAGRA